jgi:hypothetical protein
MSIAQGHYCHILKFILVFVCRTGTAAINWAINWMENDDRRETMSYTQNKRTFLNRNYSQLLAGVASLFPNTVHLGRVYVNCLGITFLTKYVGHPPLDSNDVECLPSSQKALPPLIKLYLIVLLSCQINTAHVYCK